MSGVILASQLRQTCRRPGARFIYAFIMIAMALTVGGAAPTSATGNAGVFLSPADAAQTVADIQRLQTEASSTRAASSQAAVPPPDAILAPILVYHSVHPFRKGETRLQRRFDVTPEVFERQLKYLVDGGYSAIGEDDLTAALSGGVRLPNKSVILTFDDGWRNQYRYAFPLLKKYGLKATFFVWTEAIDRRLFMNWRQVRELKEAGMEVEAHSLSHPYLTRLKDGRLRDEIFGVKRTLEEKLGVPVRHFAYPFGLYDDEVVKLVKAAGYATARTTNRGAYQTKNGIYTLNSLEVTNDFNHFVSLLGGDRDESGHSSS